MKDANRPSPPVCAADTQADVAQTLTHDEVRRVARNIAKLQVLLRKPS